MGWIHALHIVELHSKSDPTSDGLAILSQSLVESGYPFDARDDDHLHLRGLVEL